MYKSHPGCDQSHKDEKGIHKESWKGSEWKQMGSRKKYNVK